MDIVHPHRVVISSLVPNPRNLKFARATSLKAVVALAFVSCHRKLVATLREKQRRKWTPSLIPLGLAARGFFLGVVDRNSSAFLQQPETVVDASFSQQLQHLALHSGPLVLTKFIGIGARARCTEIIVIHGRLGEIQRVH
jgi:hypothetical protein